MFLTPAPQQNDYYDRIDSGPYFDDENCSKTQHYNKALAEIRRFHDSLQRTSDDWESFSTLSFSLLQYPVRFVDVNWSSHRTSIIENFAELRRYQRVLAQRGESFNRMKDGVGRNSNPP